jgi:hypothetical protein
LSKNPPKQENLGTRCKKNPQCPKIGEILGTGEKIPRFCPNGLDFNGIWDIFGCRGLDMRKPRLYRSGDLSFRISISKRFLG